ncbi:MAG: pyridoxal-phosphate dependent enzyme [Promethearchaeota archaeon]|nr:MAG: pyridoxal-phosphate dependent enzyme [Candidatus Lokiarchaeota archaeon]
MENKDRKQPLLFKNFPSLKNNIPWIPLLTNLPTSINELRELEKRFEIQSPGGLYIKRDDKDHHIYGGNKLRKFEFIFAKILEEDKKGVMTFGGVGTNHGLACAIIAKELGLNCDLFLAHQPITWHVQRSLLLYDYFDANLHYAKSYGGLVLKGLWFRLTHSKYYMMLPGGSTLLGFGSPSGTLGFINAVFELKAQIEKGVIPEPDIIYVPCGSAGTAAGLIAGCKLLELKTKVHAVAVSTDLFASKSSIIKNSNKALKHLQKLDKSFPSVEVKSEDFELIKGYLGSEYGAKTKRGQKAIDIVMELEGQEKGFKLETTYTGKAMAAMLDYIQKESNKMKTILFWNTYNSNNLDQFLKETKFNFQKLPKEFHKFYNQYQYQCWQIKDCPNHKECDAYLNHEYRCWKVKRCSENTRQRCRAYEKLKNTIHLEDS